MSRLQKVREKTAFQWALKGQESYTKPRGLGKGAFKAEETALKGPKCEHAWALVSVSVYTVCNVCVCGGGKEAGGEEAVKVVLRQVVKGLQI